MRLVPLLILLLLLWCIVAVRKSGRKRTHSQANPGPSSESGPSGIDVQNRSLEDWLLCDLLALQLECNRVHLSEAGSKQQLALRLFQFYHPSDEPSTVENGAPTQPIQPPSSAACIVSPLSAPINANLLGGAHSDLLGIQHGLVWVDCGEFEGAFQTGLFF